jgi:hypothetical protein
LLAEAHRAVPAQLTDEPPAGIELGQVALDRLPSSRRHDV